MNQFASTNSGNRTRWSRIFASKLAHDLFALIVLAIASYGSYLGIDALMFVNSDTLYPVQIQYFGWFEYRPPPSNNLFPDVLTHSLVQIWFNDPLAQKVAAGILLFALTAVFIGLTLGYSAALALVAIYSVCGFYFFDSTAHFSLPFCVALFLWIRASILRNFVLFAVVFSDLLVLLPLAIYWSAQHSARRKQGVPPLHGFGRYSQSVIVGLAIILNILYSEFNTSAAALLPLAAGFAIVACLAERMDRLQLFAGLTIVGLLGMALVGIAPERYALPVGASILMVMIGNGSLLVGLNWQAQWRIYALPMAYISLLVSGLSADRVDQLTEKYDCLARALQTREIRTVAAEHWTAKQLYFALQAVPGISRTKISQMDFSLATYHLWMAPHAFYGDATKWAIKNRYACKTFTSEPRYCGQFEAASVVGITPLCGIFDLVEYNSPIPKVAKQKPANKVEAIYRQGQRYVEKIFAKLDRRNLI